MGREFAQIYADPRRSAWIRVRFQSEFQCPTRVRLGRLIQEWRQLNSAGRIRDECDIYIDPFAVSRIEPTSGAACVGLRPCDRILPA
jgi:hypothetical protein